MKDDLTITIGSLSTEVKKFRRFACAYIYQDNIYKITNNIKDSKFVNSQQLIIPLNNDAAYIPRLNHVHNTISAILVQFFNDPEIIKIFRNKIYNIITDEDDRNSLNDTLIQIQSSNPKYLALLFNVTILDDIAYVIL